MDPSWVIGGYMASTHLSIHIFTIDPDEIHGRGAAAAMAMGEKRLTWATRWAQKPVISRDSIAHVCSAISRGPITPFITNRVPPTL